MSIGDVISTVANMVRGVRGQEFPNNVESSIGQCEKSQSVDSGTSFNFELFPEGLMAVRQHSVDTVWNCSYPSPVPGFSDRKMTVAYQVRETAVGTASLEDFADGKPFTVHTDREYQEYSNLNNFASYISSETCPTIEDYKYDSRWSGCFSGETFLRLRDGGVISFGELATMQATGTPLPEVTSFDASTGTFVYQPPVAILTHSQITSTMMYLRAIGTDGESASLEVTTNHPLRVERAGQQDWIEAGQLRDGDQLIGPNGERYDYDAEGTIRVDGVMTVYDVSFGREGLNPHPTQWVSSDGIHWIGAHNKPIF